MAKKRLTKRQQEAELPISHDVHEIVVNANDSTCRSTRKVNTTTLKYFLNMPNRKMMLKIWFPSLDDNIKNYCINSGNPAFDGIRGDYISA
jgi:hypothetical protein